MHSEMKLERDMWGVEVSHHVCFILQYWGQRM